MGQILIFGSSWVQNTIIPFSIPKRQPISRNRKMLDLSKSFYLFFYDFFFFSEDWFWRYLFLDWYIAWKIKIGYYWFFCNIIWWRWWNCRFDGKDFLRRFKGKKIMYIGDSLSLNHWQSMVCLLHVVVSDQSRILQETNDTISTFIFQVSIYII